MKNGLGVMTDDLVAAFYAIAVIQVANPSLTNQSEICYASTPRLSSD